MELLLFVEFAINASMWNSSRLFLQQLVFGKKLWALVDLVEGLHPIKAAQLLVSKPQDVLK